jgi:hypothetical protein
VFLLVRSVLSNSFIWTIVPPHGASLGRYLRAGVLPLRARVVLAPAKKLGTGSGEDQEVIQRH